MRRPDWNDNKISLHNTGQPLGVECLDCAHRGLAFTDPADFASLKGDMTLLSALRFKCTKCGSRKVQLWMFNKEADRRAFMERPLGGPEF